MPGPANLVLHAAPRRGGAAVAAPLPRVLYALTMTPGHKFGSIEEQIVTLARRFQAEDGLFLPLFICDPDKANVNCFRERGVQAQCLDIRFRYRTLQAFLRLLRDHRIDAIHWNFTSPLGNAHLWLATLFRPGIKHFYTDHISRWLPAGPPPQGPKRWIKRLLLDHYAQVWCVSNYVRDSLKDQRIWPDHRVATCLHFVNTDRFRPDAATRHRLRRQLGTGGEFVVLYVGQLIDAKGVDVLIRAMAQLPNDAVLWILGAGAARQALDERIAAEGLSDRVRILGHEFDVAPYLQAADCFVCPSLWGEAAGLVNLEAAACGLPVVASRIGGIPEYIDDGETGMLFEAGNADALADCLNRLVRDAALCRCMGEQARAMAVERFSTDVRLPEVLELYRCH